MEKENFTKKYEDTTQTSYSELGKNKKEFKNWGIAERNGECFEFYKDPKYIKQYFTNPIIQHLEGQNIESDKNLKLVDFGGGDGILINELTKQLKENGYPNLSAINLDYTYKSLVKMNTGLKQQEDNKNIFAVRADITNSPLKPNSVDIGASRHVIQYLGKEHQPEMLKSIYDKLKDGSIFVMQWPGSENPGQSPIITDFYAQIAAVITNTSPNEVAENKYFISYQEVEKIADEIGFKIIKSGRCEEKLGGLTAEGFSDRFKVTDEQRRKINQIFEQLFNKYGDDPETFEMIKDKEGIIYSIWHHNFIVLEK